MKRSKPTVAIDGPAGSGKSTVARMLAKRLAFVHIDTGALYRGVALLALRNKVLLTDESERRAGLIEFDRHRGQTFPNA